jgi:hypothetical protein
MIHQSAGRKKLVLIEWNAADAALLKQSWSDGIHLHEMKWIGGCHDLQSCSKLP